MTEDEAAGFVRSLGVSLNVHEVEQAVKYLVASCGNHAVLQEFLKQSTTDNHTGLAISLLGQLSAKDLRDVRLEVLNDHLWNTPAKTSGSYYYSALLNPRISTEELTAYKSFFRKVLDERLPQPIAHSRSCWWSGVSGILC